MTIFVIVENIPTFTDVGDEDIHECICPHLGYYTDMAKVDEKVDELTIDYHNDNPDDEDWEERFGYLPLEHKA